MLSCHKFWFLLVLAILLENHLTRANPVAEAKAEPIAEAGVQADIAKLLLIKDDVIPDKVEKDTKKVIRVNPLDLPPIKEDPNALNEDSSLYNIQSLKPYMGKRKYIQMHRTKPQKANVPQAPLSDTPIIRGFSLLPSPEKTLKPKHQAKKKHLHFLYNQEDLAGNLLSKTMRVHVAPGAYPVYYVLSKTNGRFGKYPLKSFDSPQAFKKYLVKYKLEHSAALEPYGEEV
ncbi:hypothetical protein FF38_06075 [Lucilia cuprina]|uniref:DUF4794 domain-containing protein n=1 Tax=Lucilia cuprina TaxID=7375 RepID=A0A0L0CLT2_LUCCU|nr:hypothetical protein FF38_06075 [Lucilia cuprina]